MKCPKCDTGEMLMFVYSESDNSGAFKSEISIKTKYECSVCDYKIER